MKKQQPTIAQMRAKVELAADLTWFRAGLLAGDDNPQIVRMRERLEVEAGALQMVLDALRGDAWQLNDTCRLWDSEKDAFREWCQAKKDGGRK